MIEDPQSIQNLTQFGVAGLMGALWLWERLYSRRRENELSEAHQHLIAQQQQLHVLTDLVQRNTAAIEHFEQTQQRFATLLERLETSRHVA